MKIIISKETVGSKLLRKKFVATIYDGLRGLLSGDKLTIDVDPTLDLPTVCAALRGIAGILDVGSDAINGAPDDDDEDEDDEADYWKKQ